MSELTKRVIVAVFGIPLLLGLTYIGGWYFFGLVLVMSLGAQAEFYQIQKNKNIYPQNYLGILAGLILLLGIQTGKWFFAGLFLLIILILILSGEMFRKQKNASTNIGVTLLGILYVPLLLGAFLYLRSFIDFIYPQVTNAGFIFIFILFASIWICDTFAYFFGKRFGKHKLYQKVSPNKTIEGGLAGLIGSIIVFLVVKVAFILPISWPAVIVFGITVGTIGQLGDLVESWFKRDVGVKDSSAFLPGHGGLLDRFDSLIFVSPVMLLLVFFLNDANLL